jgi:hypothetical protein
MTTMASCPPEPQRVYEFLYVSHELVNSVDFKIGAYPEGARAGHKPRRKQ